MKQPLSKMVRYPPEVLHSAFEKLVRPVLEKNLTSSGSKSYTWYRSHKYTYTITSLFCASRYWASVLSVVCKIRPPKVLPQVLIKNATVDAESIIFYQDLGFMMDVDMLLQSFDAHYLKLLVQRYIAKTNKGSAWIIMLCIQFDDRDVLIQLLTGDADLKEEHIALASKLGKWDIVRLLSDAKCPWDWHVAFNAAEQGNLEMLKYSAKTNKKYGTYTHLTPLYAAAKNGHLDCLEYAHHSGCEWGEDVAMIAAQNGHLACLQYAHEHGCPWDSQTRSVAYHNNQRECLRYAKMNGCPRMSKSIKRQVKRGMCNCVIKVW